MKKKMVKGASLVELLAVIVIMGIIAAIAVPTTASLIKNSRKKAVGNEFLSFVQAMDTYIVNLDQKEKSEYYSDGQYKILGNDEKLAEYYANDVIYNNIVDKSLVEFVLNDGADEVVNVIFKDGFAYKKDNRYYKDFTYDSNKPSCKTNTEVDNL